MLHLKLMGRLTAQHLLLVYPRAKSKDIIDVAPVVYEGKACQAPWTFVPSISLTAAAPPKYSPISGTASNVCTGSDEHIDP